MDDREAILVRRARFLSSALATISCSPPGSSTGSGTALASDTPSTSGPTRAVLPRPLPPWTEVRDHLPPRGNPGAVKGLELDELQWMEQQLDRQYGALEAAWSAARSCNPADRDCEASLNDALRSLQELHAARRSALRCKSETATMLAREEAHDRALDLLLSGDLHRARRGMEERARRRALADRSLSGEDRVARTLLEALRRGAPVIGCVPKRLGRARRHAGRLLVVQRGRAACREQSRHRSWARVPRRGESR